MITPDIGRKTTVITPAEARILVDERLQVFFAEHVEQAARISPDYVTLWESIARLSLAGGKRIRPYITLMTYQALSSKPVADILPLAVSQELLHLALLIHDDVIDRDYIRYGIDNISGQYNKIYAPHIDDTDERQHFSDSAAILAGDLLLSGGYQLMQTSNLSAHDLMIASQVFSQAVYTVAAGELLDTESAFKPFDSVDSIMIARYKTAHYSFVTPIVMGARLADAPESTIRLLEDFGEHIGIAYQLVDDLIGMFGSSHLIGKSVLTDIHEAKHTYLVEQFKAHATPEQLQSFESLFGKKDITEDEAKLFKQMLIDSGARDQTEKTITAYADQALAILKATPIDAEARRAFESLVERAIKRDR